MLKIPYLIFLRVHSQKFQKFQKLRIYFFQVSIPKISKNLEILNFNF